MGTKKTTEPEFEQIENLIDQLKEKGYHSAFISLGEKELRYKHFVNSNNDLLAEMLSEFLVQDAIKDTTPSILYKLIVKKFMNKN